MELNSQGLINAGTFHIRITLTLIRTFSFPGRISATSSNFDSSLSAGLNTIATEWK
jgi:hypothetical protein